MYNKICSTSTDVVFGYGETEGTLELRTALRDYLLRARGISCRLEQIMITSGSTQGLSLISKLLYRPEAEVIVEDPLHAGLLEVILSNGYSINPVPVDNFGMKSDLLEAEERVSFVYVTPSHQFPLGGILPIKRRIELIRFAEKSNCYIVEDDYDSEIRYEGQPISSLYELEPNRVIYVGSFSKILAPAFRIGYLILPDTLIPEFMKLKRYNDVHTETITQLVLAQFIKEGKLEKHIWKMRKDYSKKRAVLIKSLELNFKGLFEVKGHAAGLHIVVDFKNVSFTEKILKDLESKGVKIYPVEKYAIEKGTHTGEIILGYGHLSIEAIIEGVNRIKEAFITKEL
jgi:GntR family transcriptional regulator/MocR family aminotransferase